MGTRSRIGIELKDHSVVSVYCHWDGYPSFNGKMLEKYYTKREDVKQLIDGGSMSCLRTRNHWNAGPSLKDENGDFIFDSEGFMMLKDDREPQPQYHAERPDEELEVMHSTFDEFCRDNMDEEYCYLYSLDGQWKCWHLASRQNEEGRWYTSPERTEIPA